MSRRSDSLPEVPAGPGPTSHAQLVLNIVALTLSQLIASGISRYAIIVNAVLPASASQMLAVAAATRQDVLIAVAAGLIIYLLDRAQGGRRRRWLLGILTAFSCVHCLMLGINVAAVRWLGTPLTVQWIYFADLFRSFTPRAAIETVASPEVLLLLILFGGAPWWSGILVRRIFSIHAVHRHLCAVIAATLAVLLLFAGSLAIRPPKGGSIRNTWENPLYALAASFLNDVPQLDRPVTIAEEVDPLISAGPVQGPLLVPGRPPDIVLIVLESVGARNIERNRKWLPNLNRLQAGGMHFPNAYATTASSVRSLFSLFVSRQPLLTLNPEIQSLRHFPFTSLPEALRQQGYQTAFFGGGDFRYQEADAFLEREGTSQIFDLTSIRCPGVPADEIRLPGAAGLTDGCLFSAAASWASASRKPYFLTIWSYEAHFPYRSDGKRLDSASPDAYRLALVEIDRALGAFRERLEQAGTLHDTLFIIIGDHGEAFGEHGRWIHSTTIFEEEIRIPLIFAGERMTAKGASQRIARLIDIAPTIVAALGKRPPSQWNGVNLFGPLAAKRAFFFTSHRGVQAGFREGTRKYVLDYGSRRYVRYSLETDPLEQRPAALSKAEYERVERIVAAWAQREKQRYPRSR